LQTALSIQTLDNFNQHSLRRITGWDNGFNSGMWTNNYEGYHWMDTGHLLLFPIVGEQQGPVIKKVFARPVVMNVDTSQIWFPPSDQPASSFHMSGFWLPRWVSNLGVLITSENIPKGNDIEAGVTLYTSDGTLVARYIGKLIDISPSGTKILIEDNTWTDLSSKKTINFNWGSGANTGKWAPIWSSDETRIYRCCYFYGDATTGESYVISDESTILEGHEDNNIQSLHHSHGVWLNDNYVLAQFDGILTYRDGPIPIFDISARTFRNLGRVANLPEAFNTMPYSRPSISPSKDFMWVSPVAQPLNDPQVYLINLKTFASQLYHSSSSEWSASGKYALLDSQVLTLSNKELRSLPPLSASQIRYARNSAWHPIEEVYADITADKSKKNQMLLLFDIEALSYRQIKLPADFLGEYYRPTVFWSPTGMSIALLAADNSLWKVDYPNLENLEQITQPMPDIKDIMWSPDESYLSFNNGTDIYIIKEEINP